jgi:hypothetical protein
MNGWCMAHWTLTSGMRSWRSSPWVHGIHLVEINDHDGNAVSIMVADGLNSVQAIGHKAFAAGEANPSSVQPAQVPGVYPELAGLKENHPDADVAIVTVRHMLTS